MSDITKVEDLDADRYSTSPWLCHNQFPVINAPPPTDSETRGRDHD